MSHNPLADLLILVSLIDICHNRRQVSALIKRIKASTFIIDNEIASNLESLPRQDKDMQIRKNKNSLVHALALMALAASLTSCAMTNSVVGDHLGAAQKFAQNATSIEKEAHREAGILNHLEAANKYSSAADDHIRAGKEYSLLGNPVQAQKQYELASEDFQTASQESLLASGENPKQ